MAIIKKDGFDFLDEINGIPESFILKGSNLYEEINYIKKEKILSIYLTYFESKDIVNLDFLKEINFIEKIIINDLDIEYSGLNYLDNLKHAILSVKNQKQYLDYSIFKYLETLSIDWYYKFPDLSNNNKLKELYIWKFKPKSKSFKEILLPKGLELLHITDSNVETLEGINCLGLRQFEAYYCSKLISLKGIERSRNSLTTLILENCKNLRDFESLWECSKIEKMILTNCGEIPSLKFLSKIQNLQMFTFSGTNIIDGNLDNLFNIDYVYFKNSKHYNHRIQKFSK